MSSVHRRILKASDIRCHPDPTCPLQSGCARFTSPLPQGIGTTMCNFRGEVITSATMVMTILGPVMTDGPSTCPKHLSQMVQDDEDAKPKTVHPPLLGAHRA